MSADPLALPSRPSPGAAGARLGDLFAEHSRMVYGVCRLLLRDSNEAEDATQQVFLSAYRSLLTGTEVRNASAWLGTIARNESRARIGARARTPLASAEELTLVSPGVEEQAIGRADAAELYAELAALPEKQREAVVLRDLYGLRYDEVAAALGTSRPSVEALLYRGRRRLQRRLRPGFAAGVLVVPLAVQESIAYAVPGFAGTAAPAGAVAVAAGVPLLAKLAAAGAAVGIAGSAGIVTERSLHDRPTPPAAEASVDRRSDPEVAARSARDSVVRSRASSQSRRAVTARAASPAAATVDARHDGEEPEPAGAAGSAPEGEHDEDHEQVEDVKPALDEHEAEPEPERDPAHDGEQAHGEVEAEEPSAHVSTQSAPADDGSSGAGGHEQAGEDLVETVPGDVGGHDGEAEH